MDSVAAIRRAFYRLVGSTEDDSFLEEQGEATNEVAYTYLTIGSREAQLWMLKVGYVDWSKRSSALTFSGSDATDGGRYVALPTDFLRTRGDRRNSPLREADGDRWGSEVSAEEDNLRGAYFYLKNQQLWLARDASPPAPIYLDYHYKHPEWSGSLLDAAIDFPMDARGLIVAEAAAAAMVENWLPGGAELEQKIERNLLRWRERARGIARRTKSPRQFRKAARMGNRW